MRPTHGGVLVPEKVANNMTVPTRANVLLPRSGRDALPDWTGGNIRNFTRADMLAMRHEPETAAP